MTNKNTYKPEILAISYRNNAIENLHYGWICVLNKQHEIIYRKGNVSNPTFLRSVAKPIQAICLIEDKINVHAKELAIICGSHSGTEKHLKVLSGFMKKQKLKESYLQCGIHLPFDENEKNILIKSNRKPSKLHNNCSGKHLGMLSVCKKNKWDLMSYLNIKHPLQQRILKNIKDLSNTNKIWLATDGCGAPTFSLPVKNIAIAFSVFTDPLSKKYKPIITSMNTNPFYVGGNGQIDTEVMKVLKGNLIVKSGGAGIIIAAKEGNSIVIKMAEGSSNIRSFVLLKILTGLGWLNVKKIKDTILEEILSGQLKNHTGKLIGKIVFEGRVN